MNLAKLEPNHVIEDLYGNTVLDFWSWAFSDLVDGNTQDIFGEFIVGAVLGTTENPRIAWDVADHIYRGRKIKVKTAAYLQHWLQAKPSRIAFPITHTHQREIRTSIPGLTLHPKPEIYVFCVFNVKERNEANALDLAKWLFFPVAAHVIEHKYRRKKTLTLKEVERVAAAVPILQLRKSIDLLIDDLNHDRQRRA